MIFFDGEGMDGDVIDAPTDGGDAMGGDDSAVSAPEEPAEETATPEESAAE